MKKSALIVCPAPPACRVGKQRKAVVSRFFRHTRLSLLAVAAATPDRWDVEIVDEFISAIDFTKHYDCVGISFMTAGAPRAYEIADTFRSLKIPVIAGGYHPTFEPEEALQHFDAVCVGDGEHSWPQMLHDLERGSLQPQYRSNPERSLSNLPVPRRDLLSMGNYLTRNTVQTSRGCPNTCEFCSVTSFYGGVYRHRPVPEVVEEIRNLSGKLIIFIDDNIVSDRPYAMSLFDELKHLNRHWFSQAEIKIAKDPELLDAAVESGCKGLFVGLESLSDRNLRSVRKGFNHTDEYQRSLETLHVAGIAIEVGLAFGFDYDTPGVFEEASEFLDENSVEVAQLTIVTPYPGTPLFDKYLQESRILTTDWAYYDFNHVVFQPKSMSPLELQLGTDNLINRFYSYNSIFKRFISSVKYLGIDTALRLALPLSLAIRKRVTSWEKRSTAEGNSLYWLEGGMR